MLILQKLLWMKSLLVVDHLQFKPHRLGGRQEVLSAHSTLGGATNHLNSGESWLLDSVLTFVDKTDKRELLCDRSTIVCFVGGSF